MNKKIRYMIPTIGNHKGLRYTYDSILRVHKNCKHEKEIVFVTENPSLKYEFNEAEIIECSKDTKFTEKINLGLCDVINRRSDCDIVCLLNDDVILFTTSVIRIVKLFSNGYYGLMNPFSNCDKLWLHNEDIEICGENLGVGLPIEWLNEKRLEEMRKYSISRPDSLSLLATHVAFYATFIDSKTIRCLGYLDESMKTTHSDFEYCDRAKKFGFVVSWNPGAFIFHFGAVTRKVDENNDYKEYHDLEACDKAKYQSKKKKIVLYSGISWEKWSVDNLYKGGIGGSETCLIYLGRYLVKNGFDVTSVIHCNSERIDDGVKYIPFSLAETDRLLDADIFISSRQPYVINEIKNSKMKKILWCHDIRFNDDGINKASGFDKIVLLSKWHRDFWMKYAYYDKYVVIPDGIDLRRFKPNAEKKYGRFIWGSSWDRGLDNAIFILSNVREKTHVDVELDVYYGDYNLIKTYESTKNDQLKLFHKFVKSAISKMKWINLHDRINQNELAEKYSSSFAWLYPTYFHETCCITALEAMAAGLPIIHNGVAGLAQYSDTGIVIDNFPESLFMSGMKIENMKPYIEATSRLLTDQGLWEQCSRASLAKVQGYTWDRVVKEKWLSLLRD